MSGSRFRAAALTLVALSASLAGAAVQLGGILDGVGPGGGGGLTPGAVDGAISGLSAGQIQALKLQCAEILGSPRRFDPELVALCSILRKL